MDILISPLEIGINDKQLSFAIIYEVYYLFVKLIFIRVGLNGKKIDGWDHAVSLSYCV